MIRKVCSKCGVEKELCEFGVVSKNKDGYRSYCKECAKNLAKKYREKNKYTRNEAAKNWRFNNPEKFKSLFTPSGLLKANKVGEEAFKSMEKGRF